MNMSRFLRVRQREGWVVVFHELHPTPLYVRTEEWWTFIALLDERHPFFSQLKERALLVTSSQEDDAEFARVEARLLRKLSVPRILYFILAQGCNFACGYCPVPRLARELGDDRLTVEDMQSGLKVWSRHLADEPPAESHVIFYGGEPLLNKPAFYAALAEIRQMRGAGGLPCDSLKLMLATNGSLVDDAIIDACLEHDVLVALGLDGGQETNDRYRRHADGNGTFDVIVDALHRLRARGVRTAVSASITPANVDRLDELSGILRELGVEKFGLNFLKGRALVDLVPLGRREAFERTSAEAVLRRHRAQGDEGYEYQVEKKIVAFRTGDFFPMDCTCYGNQLVVRPNGRISNCPFSGGDLGHVRSLGSDFRIAKTEVVAAWRQRLPLRHPEFRDRDAKALCGPGCAWGARDLTGDELAVDAALTAFTEEIFDELIWSEFTRG